MNSSPASRLPRAFFQIPTRKLARQLLGKTLARRQANGVVCKGIVVEVEAYLAQRDAASHSHIGLRTRNATMFLPAGRLYVYTIHTRYCMNVVSGPTGVGEAVLIRAVEPVSGVPQMWHSRFDLPLPSVKLDPRQRVSLTQGPGRLCQALAIDRNLDGIDLCTHDEIWFEPAVQPVQQRPWQIRTSPRIGISKARNLPLRWFIDGHRFVSGCARDHSQGRHWSFED